MKFFHKINIKNYSWYFIILAFFLLLISCNSWEGNEGLSGSDRTIKKDVFLGTENVGGLKEHEVQKIIERYAENINKDAVDAAFNDKTWEIIKEKAGKRVNVEKTLDELFNAGESNMVNPVAEDIEPRITSEKFLRNLKIIGEYTTKIYDKDSSRMNNLRLASQKINFCKLSPGQEFSFNKIVGKRTESKGYEDAPIILKTEDGIKKEDDIGGGICQITTTLYNAVEKCKLKILERHEHSKKVIYAPEGKDATVNYGVYDFRFSNSRDQTIMIKTYLNTKTFTVKILEYDNK